ncbi:MAG: S9 family peptidase [Myxococcales bacterium]|nr:S9 family peptidase [Myxococcales bacterium]
MRSRAKLLSVAAVLLVGCATTHPALGPTQLTAATSMSDVIGLPDGGIAWLGDATGAVELWRRDPDGDTRALTSLNTGIESPTASAALDLVVVAADGGGDEVYDLWRVPLGGGAATRIAQTDGVSESSPRFSPRGDRLAVLADPGTPFQPQLHLADPSTGALTPLTRGDTPVWSPVWSPDGSRLAVFRSGDWAHGDLVIVPTDAGPLPPAVVVAPPADGALLSPVAFSPDGAVVLATTLNSKGFQQLALVPPAGGEARRIGPGDWDVEAAAWNAAVGIVFTRNVAGSSELLRMMGPDAVPVALSSPLGVVSGLDLRGDGVLLFDRNDSKSPGGLWRLDTLTPGAEPVALTTSTLSGLIAARPFAMTASDGTPLSGFVYVPTEGAAPFPAVAFVHGGPDGQSRDRYDADRQALVQAGYLVVDVNFRGSTGFGRAFADLDNGDWGGGDRRDIRDAVLHFVGQGLVDRGRVAIMGGSFGGYMAVLALALDDDLYYAGVDLYGMPDLTADFEMTKDRYEAWYRTEMGTPDEKPELFRERSPLTHVDRIRAPLLVLHGENDTDVPKVQSDALVEALRARGRPVDYVVYPGEGHVFSKRETRRDASKRVLEFLGRMLR